MLIDVDVAWRMSVRGWRARRRSVIFCEVFVGE
jgi:hypothetical protein